MFILTQDGMRILPFGEHDSICIEEERKMDHDTMRYSDSEMEYWLWLYGNERTVIATYDNKIAAINALEGIYDAISADLTIVSVPMVAK